MRPGLAICADSAPSMCNINPVQVCGIQPGGDVQQTGTEPGEIAAPVEGGEAEMCRGNEWRERE